MPIFIHACEVVHAKSKEIAPADSWLNLDRIAVLSRDSTGVYAQIVGTNVLFRVDKVCTDSQLLLESIFTES